MAHLGRSPKERWVLATLAGVLNGIGFIDIGAMSLVANVPLLLGLRHSRTLMESAFLAGWVGVLGGLHIYGIINYGWFLLLGFSLYTGSQMVLYGILFHLLWRTRNSAMNIILPAVIWGVTEWLRTIGPLCMPASYVGNIADSDILQPWLLLAAWIGGLGVSTLVALCQSIIFHWLAGNPGERKAASICAMAVLVLGSVGFFLQPQPEGKKLSVIGVQGGLANSQYDAAQADPAAMRNVVRTFGKLTQDAYARNPDLVVWPETAVRAPILRTPALQSQLFPSAGHRSALLAGLIETDRRGRRYNAVVAVEPGGRIQDTYRKTRLVPSAEGHLTPGKSARPVAVGAALAGIMICLESVYPDMARRLVADGAEFLVVASNDAGFGRSPITQHMTNRAIVRAVETHRWLIRVGQAGVSALIGPDGQVHRRLGLFRPGLLEGDLERRTGKTWYVRWGNWWTWLLFLFLVIAGWERWQTPAVQRTRSV